MLQAIQWNGTLVSTSRSFILDGINSKIEDAGHDSGEQRGQ